MAKKRQRKVEEAQQENTTEPASKKFKPTIPAMPTNTAINFLSHVPSDVVQIILSFCDANALAKMITTCKQVYQDFQTLHVDSINGVRLWYLNGKQEKRILDSRIINYFENTLVKPLCSASEYYAKLANVYNLNAADNFAGALLQAMFAYNKLKKQQFVVAGGAVTAAFTGQDGIKYYFGSMLPGDIDVFLLLYGYPEEENSAIMKQVLLEAEKNTKVKNYVVLMHSNTINIVSEKHLDTQIITRQVNSLEELLLFFDLDYCRFAYDGNDIFTTREGLRAMEHSCNVVPVQHNHSGMYFKRAVKYGNRGIKTYFEPIHPLEHLHKFGVLAVEAKEAKNFSALELEQQVYDDDAEMYTNFARLNQESLLHIYLYGVENFAGESEDSVYGTLIMKSEIAKTLVNIEHTIALSISELFTKNQSQLFTEGYRDAHLLKKYHIAKCYMCNKYCQFYNNEDATINRICLSCWKLNSDNKKLVRDLNGAFAIVTGGRCKIGYSTALKLLQCNAKVLVTTRFIQDALTKFSQEPDFASWKSNLLLYPLDMRDLNQVNQFITYVKSNFERVDILINNAAQTVRRPVPYYSTLIDKEQKALNAQKESLKQLTQGSKNDTTTVASVFNSALDATTFVQVHQQCIKTTATAHTEEDKNAKAHHFPQNEKDQFGEPVDRRSSNTWNMKLHQINHVELIEVQTVNNIAPTMLVSQLLPMMQARSDFKPTQPFDEEDVILDYKPAKNIGLPNSYIINVTSIEGTFETNGKTNDHIHTNISKAALNMLTRSAADYYASYGILMNSVDTGWISSAVKTFQEPPLTVQDGAARILHPIMSSSTLYGKLLKDYRITKW